MAMLNNQVDAFRYFDSDGALFYWPNQLNICDVWWQKHHQSSLLNIVKP
jgi:hypothetical protein